MSVGIKNINKKLEDIIGPEKGYFGRVHTWGQGLTEFELIGFVPTENFKSMLSAMTDEQRINLVMIMNYFEIHMHPLKNLLNTDEPLHLYNYYSQIAWSHFATVVMFGMLEVAVKGKKGLSLENKGKKIKKFLEDNLSEERKQDITRRYSTEEIFNYKKAETFSGVVDHMWKHVRCGFVHDVGIESKGLEYIILTGIGTKDNPIRPKSDVPMPEWLQVTWQAILNSYGYRGLLEHPKINRKR